jgi:hypothetical protein
MRYAIALAALLAATSPAGAIVYELNPLTLWYQFDPSQLATLTGTITTDGTFGAGLEPSIITGWDFQLEDDTQKIQLDKANSEITNFTSFNITNLLTTTPTPITTALLRPHR